MNKEKSFFSISFKLIPVDQELDFDLYVNASKLKNVQKYIKVFPKAELFQVEDLESFKEKYLGLYVSEDQRENYFFQLARKSNIPQEEILNLVKKESIKVLSSLYGDKYITAEKLSDYIHQCQKAVEEMVFLLEGKSLDDLGKLIAGLSSHDFYTYDHSINVSMYCIQIYKVLQPKASKVELVNIGLGGLLHDLGKLKIDTAILNKPAGLNDQEFAEIKKHPDFGIKLLQEDQLKVSKDINLEVIMRIVAEHHENWDGKGYPKGLKEKESHPMARVCAIADFFDAVTTKRSYADVMTFSQALEVMGKNSGSKLDPKLFKLFAASLNVNNKVDKNKSLSMDTTFDPSIPYAKFPLKESVREIQEEFGKVISEDFSEKK
jgi:HD-GYP domain-containing protein (c-di-GMP phosphodiesterase class II)